MNLDAINLLIDLHDHARAIGALATGVCGIDIGGAKPAFQFLVKFLVVVAPQLDVQACPFVADKAMPCRLGFLLVILFAGGLGAVIIGCPVTIASLVVWTIGVGIVFGRMA